MYSLEQIIAMNKKATKEAKSEGSTLYIAKSNADEGVRACKRLGDYIPKGWQKVNSFFVDSSGFGSEGEGALTFGQLLTKVRKGFGYAIGETGQFQLHINEYKKI